MTVAAPLAGAGASGAPAKYPLEAFQRNLTVAEWMVAYDRCARTTFDLVMMKGRPTQVQLSPIWFCLQSGGRWRAAYGRMSDGGFVPAAVFDEFTPGRFAEQVDVVDPQFENIGRALADAQKVVPPIQPDLAVRSSFYTRFVDHGIQVWVIPALQSNGVLAYGSTRLFEYDARGMQRRREVTFGGTLQGVRTNRELDFVLPNYDDDVPTVGNIYIVLKYRRLFRSLTIETNAGASTIVDSADGPRWQHTPW